MPKPIEPQSAGAAVADPVRFQLIEAARENWIDRLIDLSRRNNLLFYKPVLSGTIDIPDGSPFLEDLLAGDAVPAQKLLPDSQDRPARILNIARKAMENLEEKGLQTLYLGLGFATWKADDGGRDVRAPVFCCRFPSRRRAGTSALWRSRSLATRRSTPSCCMCWRASSICS